MKRNSVRFLLVFLACLAGKGDAQSENLEQPRTPALAAVGALDDSQVSVAGCVDPPCPICKPSEFEGYCQPRDAQFLWSIDRVRGGGIVADDFIAGDTEIHEFCARLTFRAVCAGCPPPVGPPATMQMYVSFSEDGVDDNDPETEPGFPGTLLPNSPERDVPVSATVIPFVDHLTSEYIIVFDPPIQGLIPGRRYWVEISAIPGFEEGVTQGEVFLRGSRAGNGWALLERDLFGTRTWSINDLHARTEFGMPQDWSFCLDGGLTAPPPMTGACCACDGTCSDDVAWGDCLRAYNYEHLNSGFVGETIGSYFPLQSCAEIVCQNEVDAAPGDACSTPMILEPALGEFTTLEYTSLCATTDGPDTLAACGEDQDLSVGNDIWVATNASCSGTLHIDTCGGGFDLVAAIYTNGTPSCPHELGQCPPNEEDRVSCSNNRQQCANGGLPTTSIQARSSCMGGSRDTLPCDLESECPGGTCEGQCFLIRLAGRDGDVGTGQIEISCERACPGSSSVVQETIFVVARDADVRSDKQRFLSFSAGDPGRRQGIRVTVDSVSEASQVYLIGSSWWVQPPEAISEAATRRVPVPGFQTFPVAKLGCGRFDADWHGVCENSQCEGGMRDGACVTSIAGNTCAGGVNDGQTCSSSDDCPGESCLTTADCGGGILHVYGEAVFSGASYSVEVIEETFSDAICFSEPVTMDTSLFGDGNSSAVCNESVG